MNLAAKRCALALSLVLLLPLAARADSFTTTFTMTIPGSSLTTGVKGQFCLVGNPPQPVPCQYGLQVSAAFSPFDASLGTLNEIVMGLSGQPTWDSSTLPTGPLTGTVTWATASAGFSYAFVPIYSYPCGPGNPCPLPPVLLGGGNFPFNVSDDVTSGLGGFEGMNPLTATLAFTCCSHGTFEASPLTIKDGSGPLQGTVDYLYTPLVAAVPEPPSLWLLATGLLALGLVCWRRRSGQI